MDLEPFGRINPCGFSGLQVTQMRGLTASLPELTSLEQQLRAKLCAQLDYDPHTVRVEQTLPE
jgi:lipoyl(octanoyl) transferase